MHCTEWTPIDFHIQLDPNIFCFLSWILQIPEPLGQVTTRAVQWMDTIQNPLSVKWVVCPSLFWNFDWYPIPIASLQSFVFTCPIIHFTSLQSSSLYSPALHWMDANRFSHTIRSKLILLSQLNPTNTRTLRTSYNMSSAVNGHHSKST